jgi:hypothetical protein
MAAYLYESSYRRFSFEQCTHNYVDYVEPNVVPGNTSFVAGFAQCTCLYQYCSLSSHEPDLAATGDSSPNTLVPLVPESFFFGLNHVQSWCILRIAWKAMGWPALLLRFLDLRRFRSRLPWPWSWIPCLGFRIQLPDWLLPVRGCKEDYGTAITYRNLGTGQGSPYLCGYVAV